MGFHGYLDTIKEVFSNKNILAISLTNGMYSLIQMMWSPFWAKYMKDYLGATATIIGMFSMISTAEGLLFQLPGGILADRYGRRKIILFGTFLRSVSPIVYFLAPSWEWIIIGALANGTMSLYMPAFNAIIADSLPQKNRGAGYGAYSTITSLPMMISPVFGGLAIEKFGYYDGVRMFLVGQVLVSILVTYIRWKMIKETVVVKPQSMRPSLVPKMSMIKELPKQIKVMMVVAIIGSFSSRLVFDFTSLYALDVIKVSPSQFGIISTVCGGITVLLALPGGMMSDRFGRKNNIMLGRTISPISQGLISVATGYESLFAARAFNSAAMAIGGSGMEAGGPSWNALIADLVPPEKRATVLGTMGTLTAVVAAPSSVIGGILYGINPPVPFQLSLVVGLTSAVIFWIGVKEPTKADTKGN
jgi:DHA1 family tetracycline resistance protein-like MFS transporter